MHSTELTRLHTPDGDAIVITKVKYLLLFRVPRTSVMPYGVLKFVASPGAQIRYTTSNRALLHQLHEAIASAVMRTGLRAFYEATRQGILPIAEGGDLTQYVKRIV